MRSNHKTKTSLYFLSLSFFRRIFLVLGCWESALWVFHLWATSVFSSSHLRTISGPSLDPYHILIEDYFVIWALNGTGTLFLLPHSGLNWVPYWKNRPTTTFRVSLGTQHVQSRLMVQGMSHIQWISYSVDCDKGWGRTLVRMVPMCWPKQIFYSLILSGIVSFT